MTSRAGDEARIERAIELEELRLAITAQSAAIDQGFAALAVELAGAALELCERSGISASWPESPKQDG
jgi:hypothetical protein